MGELYELATIGDRIKEIRVASDLSRDAFSKILDEKPSKIQDIESGRQRVNDEFLRKLIGRFPVDLNWLFGAVGFGGEGYPRIEPVDQGRPLAGHFNADGEDYSLIRRLDLSISAGSGLMPVEEAEVERLAFSRTWLQRSRLSPDLCVIVKVAGDCMAPTIPDGALALLNCAERWSTKPGIYAFTRDGEAYVKRLSFLSINDEGKPTALAVTSDNPAFVPLVLQDAELAPARFNPVGRVRAVLTDFTD